MRAGFVLTTAILTLLLLTTCRRDKYCCGPATKPGLIGSWSLIRMDGGFAGSIIVPPDSPVILTLNNDYTYQVQDRSTIVTSGTFRVTDTPVITLSNAIQPVLIFSAGVPPLGTGLTVYSLSQDTLFLGTDVFDGYEGTYLKIN